MPLPWGSLSRQQSRDIVNVSRTYGDDSHIVAIHCSLSNEYLVPPHIDKQDESNNQWNRNFEIVDKPFKKQLELDAAAAPHERISARWAAVLSNTTAIEWLDGVKVALQTIAQEWNRTAKTFVDAPPFPVAFASPIHFDDDGRMMSDVLRQHFVSALTFWRSTGRVPHIVVSEITPSVMYLTIEPPIRTRLSLYLERIKGRTGLTFGTFWDGLWAKEPSTINVFVEVVTRESFTVSRCRPSKPEPSQSQSQSPTSSISSSSFIDLSNARVVASSQRGALDVLHTGVDHDDYIDIQRNLKLIQTPTTWKDQHGKTVSMAGEVTQDEFHVRLTWEADGDGNQRVDIIDVKNWSKHIPLFLMMRGLAQQDANNNETKQLNRLLLAGVDEDNGNILLQCDSRVTRDTWLTVLYSYHQNVILDWMGRLEAANAGSDHEREQEIKELKQEQVI